MTDDVKEYRYKDVAGQVYHFTDWESNEKSISICHFDMKVTISNSVAKQLAGAQAG